MERIPKYMFRLGTIVFLFMQTPIPVKASVPSSFLFFITSSFIAGVGTMIAAIKHSLELDKSTAHQFLGHLPAPLKLDPTLPEKVREKNEYLNERRESIRESQEEWREEEELARRQEEMRYLSFGQSPFAALKPSDPQHNLRPGVGGGSRLTHVVTFVDPSVLLPASHTTLHKATSR